MRRVLALAVALAFLAGAGTAWATIHGTYQGYPVVKVVVNGKELQPDVPAIIMDGRTLLPVRAVAEALGAKVEWDQHTYTAKLSTALTKEEVLSAAKELYQSATGAMPKILEMTSSALEGGTTKAEAQEIAAKVRKEAESQLSKAWVLLRKSEDPYLLIATISAAYCQWHFYELTARTLEDAAEGRIADSDKWFKLAQQWQHAFGATMDWLGALARQREQQPR